MKSTNTEQLYHPPRRRDAVIRSSPQRQRAETQLPDTVPAFRKIKDAAPVLGISQYRLRQLVRESAVPFIRSGPTYYVDLFAAHKVLCEMAASNMVAASGGDADGAHQ